MPLLTFNNPMTNIFIEKADVLKKIFFPAFLKADVSNLKDYLYPSAKKCPNKITEQQVLMAIYQPKIDKIPGSDGILNQFLEAYANKLSNILMLLFSSLYRAVISILCFQDCKCHNYEKTAKKNRLFNTKKLQAYCFTQYIKQSIRV